MDKIAKRYLISGAIGITAMLSALGIVLYKAGSKLTAADAQVQATPFAAALTLPTVPENKPEPPKSEAPPPAPAADLTNAFGAALGVDVKKSPAERGASSSAPAPSKPSADSLDLGSVKDRDARFGGHDLTPTGVHQVAGHDRAGKSGKPDEKMTFETQFK